jgi:hypothetical protein
LPKLAAHQFKGVGDLYYIFDARGSSQSFNFSSSTIATHSPDHRSFSAMNYMSLIATLLDSIYDMLDFFDSRSG